MTATNYPPVIRSPVEIASPIGNEISQVNSNVNGMKGIIKNPTRLINSSM